MLQARAFQPSRPMHGFRPDSALVTAIHASPNHGPRRRGVDALILHYTGMASAEAALQRLCDPAAEVSCHYLIYEDGSIQQLVEEKRRAWHAGQSFWAGERDMNSASIGIEIANGGPDFGSPPFADAQIDAVIALAHDIIARHKIPPPRILAHSDIAPLRKADPGEYFPWRRLAKAGIGHFVEPVAIGDDRPLARGAAGEGVEELQRLLTRYGYEVDGTGHYDARTEAVVTAFQRHFRPERVDGRADRSTVATLRGLLQGLRA
jgi:N-acetylmuramoyl-L-alanine amidase